MYTTLNFPSIYDDVFYLQVQNTLGSDPDGELSRKVRKLKTKVKTLTTTLNRLVSRLARDSCASNPCKYDHTRFTSSSCMFFSSKPVMSQTYPVPFPLPQPKSRPLPDSCGNLDTLNLTYCNSIGPDESRIICDIDVGTKKSQTLRPQLKLRHTEENNFSRAWIKNLDSIE